MTFNKIQRLLRFVAVFCVDFWFFLSFFCQKMPVFLVCRLLKNVKFYFLFCCVSVIYVFMILFLCNFFWYIQNLLYICSVFEREIQRSLTGCNLVCLLFGRGIDNKPEEPTSNVIQT